MNLKISTEEIRSEKKTLPWFVFKKFKGFCLTTRKKFYLQQLRDFSIYSSNTESSDDDNSLLEKGKKKKWDNSGISPIGDMAEFYDNDSTLKNKNLKIEEFEIKGEKGRNQTQYLEIVCKKVGLSLKTINLPSEKTQLRRCIRGERPTFLKGCKIVKGVLPPKTPKDVKREPNLVTPVRDMAEFYDNDCVLRHKKWKIERFEIKGEKGRNQTQYLEIVCKKVGLSLKTINLPSEKTQLRRCIRGERPTFLQGWEIIEGVLPLRTPKGSGEASTKGPTGNTSKELYNRMTKGKYTLFNPFGRSEGHLVHINNNNFNGNLHLLAENCTSYYEDQQKDFQKNALSVKTNFSALIRQWPGCNSYKNWQIVPGIFNSLEEIYDQFPNVKRRIEGRNVLVSPESAKAPNSELSPELIKRFREGKFIIYNSLDPNNIIMVPEIQPEQFDSLAPFVKYCMQFGTTQQQADYKARSRVYHMYFRLLLQPNKLGKKTKSYLGWRVSFQPNFSVDMVTKEDYFLFIPTDFEIFFEGEVTLVRVLDFFTYWFDSFASSVYCELWKKFLKSDLNDMELKLLPFSERKKEIDGFRTVDSEDKMFQFLKNSNCIYHRICNFFNQNLISSSLIDKSLNHQFQEHHIHCLYLNNNYGSNFIHIEKNYNKINVPYLIHIFLHIIRYYEFRYGDDGIFIKTTGKKIAEKSSNTISDSLASFLQNAFKKISSGEAFNNNFYLSNRNYWIKNLKPIVRDKFKKTMVFLNSVYEGVEPQIFKANLIELPVDLSNKLFPFIQDHIKINNLNSQHNFNIQKHTPWTYFERYLSKDSSSNHPFGWELLSQHQFESNFRFSPTKCSSNKSNFMKIQNQYMLWINVELKISLEIFENSNLSIENLVEFFYYKENSIAYPDKMIELVKNEQFYEYCELFYDYIINKKRGHFNNWQLLNIEE